MARKTKKPRAKKESSPATKEAAPTTASDAPSGGRRRDPRPHIYAGVDALTAIIWAWLVATKMPNRHGWATLLLWGMIALPVVMGAAMLVRRRWSWRAGALACGVLLLSWLILVVVLLMTAGFLAGVYGGFGEAAAMGSAVAALLSLEVVALLPALQLKYLMTRAGRRQFGLGPLWR